MIPMHALAQFGIDAVTALFFLGLAGSIFVIVLSFIEDLTELFGD